MQSRPFELRLSAEQVASDALNGSPEPRGCLDQPPEPSHIHIPRPSRLRVSPPPKEV